MDSIQSSMKGMMEGTHWEERYEAMKQAVWQDPRVQQFMKAHPEITENEMLRELTKLYHFTKEWSNCDACPGLDACPNTMQGYQPHLSLERSGLTLTYHPCKLKRKAEEESRRRNLIQSYSIPKDVLQATFQDISFEKGEAERNEAVTSALKFAREVEPGVDGRGLYLYGSFGIGKTFLAGAISNELAHRDISSMIIYVPDFFREMKQSVAEGTVQTKLDEVKDAEVLILDDLGAETMSGWVRDDILGVILQHRMLEKLPTIFTSNFDFQELEDHLAYSHKGGTERMKAKRIMERIRPSVQGLFLSGKNRRES
ncbi:replicative DNA helicase loader DnaI [Salsuginibacillus halophilus]|uniref:Replicative DNA helicase loader DnaI n=1 Tax=Salsuginibacillus halophilus TaxID=517424 RepID=A0A2P8HCV6_9BACI|nr:primosomal protein DnaI [Salsuginibacillus halophilus]PSL44059.1 replicative DNA helicase loader DnaI [Salsuginibacillus halophilus]